MADNRFLRSISASSLRNVLPRSISSRSAKPRKTKFSSENTPPPDPNIIPVNNSAQFAKSPPSKLLTPENQTTRSDGHDEVSPPLEQKEIVESDYQSETSRGVDPPPPVKVVVRIRPVHEIEGIQVVKKVSADTLSVGERNFTFDSVLDSNSNQEDVFQVVGIPLVKEALAGYNTSVLSYGQSGSGKTYTLWGPPSAMVEDPSPRSHQGIVPRIFHMLFSEIAGEKENPEGKQINYQCRCSFLEIYNEQIGDLLDPTQRNLEIKDDPKNGLYVENLTEEYVTSYEDVTQILIKGLSSRKVGATRVNSKSSRSHIVFTFIMETWSKGVSSKCFSASKTSRITFVDLAGLDTKSVEDAGRQHVQEDKNVKKSLSQLGHVVNNLAKSSQPENYADASYGSSCLTSIFRESLGGNSKLTVICNISPNRNSGEILSTLRFGQRVKFVRNEPIINEISEDDVNDLSDQIRQLKEELIRAKSDVYSSGGSENGHFKGQNVRDSLNQLRVSLNRSLILPNIDNDHEEEVYVGEDDVKELHQQLANLQGCFEENLRAPSEKRGSILSSSVKESCGADLPSEDDFNSAEEKELEETYDSVTSAGEPPFPIKTSRAMDTRNSVSISSCHHSSILEEPTLSESPKIRDTQRKSMVASSSFLSSQNNVLESSRSLKRGEHIRSSLHSSKIFPTESLATSIQRGLQIIDHHQQNSASDKSSLSFSFEHLTLQTCPEADKSNASVQILNSSAAALLCSSCQKKINNNSSKVEDSLKTWIVDEAENPNKVTDQEAKDVVNDLTNATKREKELERICAEQAAKIEQLSCQVEQYKMERQKSMVDQKKDHKDMGCSQPEVIKEKCEIKEVQEVSDLQNESTHFDVNEKEALLQEIQTLRSKLQSYTAATPNKSTESLTSSLLSRSIQLQKSVDCRNSSDEELEKERQRWTEMESEWICLTDELRVDLEAHRHHAEKVEMALKLEKSCTEELDDALSRSVLGHARMVEHYAELQEKHNELVLKHRAIMEGVAELKRAAAKAGAKGRGKKFAKSLAAELSALTAQREREREFLKKENKNLKIQLGDTAEAVHAAGELLARLREAEQAASVAEDNFANLQQENEKLKKQLEKVKSKHKMEIITMKQYLAESRLPESALQPLYREDSDIAHNSIPLDDDQSWRAEFGAIYQEHL
ncbi:hypothetical protein SLA2020_305190 [Shorea laevis]